LGVVLFAAIIGKLMICCFHCWQADLLKQKVALQNHEVVVRQS
jgi:hypothetical protein